MRGRYGLDFLGKATQSFILVMAVVSFLTKSKVAGGITLASIFYFYFRAFSRNISARREENRKFVELAAPVTKRTSLGKRKFEERKTHRFVKCAKCGQVLRVPKGKGKLKVTCTKCGHTFEMKS